MANVFHESYKQSTLAQSASQGGTLISDYQYDLPRPFPCVYQDYHTKMVVQNMQFAGSSSVELSSFGILKDLYIKWVVSWTNNGSQAGKLVVAKNPYATIVKRIALMNSSREIFQLYGEDILLHTKSIKDAGERRKWLMAGDADVKLSSANAQTAGSGIGADGGSVIKTADSVANSMTFYTRVPFSFFEGHLQSSEPNKTCPNLRFTETTRLLIETNPGFCVVSGGTSLPVSDLKIDTCEVYGRYDIPSPDAMQSIEEQYSMDAPSSQLHGNSVMNETSITATAVSQKHKVKIYNTNLTRDFTIMVHPTRSKTRAELLAIAVADGTSNGTDKIIAADAFGAAAGTAISTNALVQLHNMHSWNVHSLANGNSRIGNDFCRITKLTVASSGRILFQTTDYKQLLLCTTNFCNWVGGKGSDVLQNVDKNGCSDDNLYMIPFSLKPNANELTSALSLRGLSTLDIEIEFDAVVGVAYDCKVITHYAQIISTETTSGRLIASTSN